MDNQINELDFVDTFLDMDHLKQSFPDHIVNVSSSLFILHFNPFCIQKGSLLIYCLYCLDHLHSERHTIENHFIFNSIGSVESHNCCPLYTVSVLYCVRIKGFHFFFTFGVITFVW